MRQYAHFTNEEVFPITQYGDFFPTVVANPNEYIQAQPELKETLLALKERGVRLFLGTNSHFEYMNVIMRATLGLGWEQLFDLHLGNCRKPVFFRFTETPFFCVDEVAKDMRGR